MSLTTAFLNTCRTAISSLPELTTFQSALTAALNGTRSARIAAWHATYTPGTAGLSPALNLRRAIRDTINAQADASGALGLLDRESAFQTLSAEFVPTYTRPPSDAEEAAGLEKLLREEMLA